MRKKQTEKTAFFVLELEVFISHVNSPGKLGPVSFVVDLLHRNIVLLTPVTEIFLQSEQQE